MRNVLVTVDKESVSVIFGRDKKILAFSAEQALASVQTRKQVMTTHRLPPRNY